MTPWQRPTLTLLGNSSGAAGNGHGGHGHHPHQHPEGDWEDDGPGCPYSTAS